MSRRDATILRLPIEDRPNGRAILGDLESARLLVLGDGNRREEGSMALPTEDGQTRDVRDATSPRLASFPAEDEAFALFVRTTQTRLEADGRSMTPEALEASLRTYHTRALVRRRNPLAALGEDVWYVYRDGHAGVRVLDDWWQCEDCASVVFDRAGAFVEADDAACALLDLPPGALTGRRWQELVPGRAPREDSADLWKLLETHGSIQSVFDVPLPGGGFRVIEYHSERTHDPERFTSRWRAIADIPAERREAAAGEIRGRPQATRRRD
jgi:PAS domain-containing protein